MKDEMYGLKISIPDDMSDERKLESINNWIKIIKTFAKVAGEESPDLTPLLEAKAKLENIERKQ